MLARNSLLWFSLSVLVCCRAEATHPGKSIAIEEYPGVRDLYRFAEEQRAKHDWPALGVGIIHKGKIIGLGMAGERKLGAKNWAALDDSFEVGSCAKSMTATVAAMLVEEGKLRWNTRVTDVFPDLQKTILPAYTNVTSEQLLGHRSGLDQWMNSNQRWTAWHREHSDKTATEKRVLFAAAALLRQPKYVPGTEHYYCNDGYLIAGSMMEKVSGQSFEELLRQRLFEPLGLKSASFSPDSKNKTDTAVWGHEPRSFGRTKAIKPDPAEYGDPPFGSPGGFIYCSLPDLLRYVDFHNRGANGYGQLLKPENFARLYNPPSGEQYALGWEVEIKRDKSGNVIERSIYHGGYSGRFRANMWFCPESQCGTVIVCNDGRGDGALAVVPSAWAERTVIVCNDGRGDGAEMSAVFRELLREFKLIK